MNDKICRPGWAVLLATPLLWGVAVADQHTTEAMHHAMEAAKSVGDAKSVGEHAAEALQHLEAAKAANPKLSKKIEDSKAELNSAINNAHHFNTDSAAKDAADARSHLEAVHE
jgi:predicted phage gp36 major capsid-like protein